MNWDAAPPGGGAGHRVLGDVTVLDLTRFFSGPQCTLLLAGLGADVIKVDDPDGGDPVAGAPPFAGRHGVSLARQAPDDLGIAYLKRARGKRSITIDLKSAEGRALFLDLCGRADVLVENFRVGVAKRLGIDYDTVRARNPGLVYCALTGYGSTGPDAPRKAYDSMVQAASGLMSITGAPGGAPLKAGSSLSDAIAGVYAALGIVSALHQRHRTGTGQFVDVAMVECLFSMLFDEPLDCYERMGLPFRQGNRIMRFSPFNSYETRDGTVVIGVATRDEWTALLAAMGRGDLAGDPQWSDVGWRIAHNADVDAVVSAWTGTLTSDALVRALDAAGVPVSAVRTIHDILRWAQFESRGVVQPLVHPQLGPMAGVHAAAFPLRFSASDTGYASPAPVPGADTREVLERMLGIDATAFEALRARGIV